MKLDRPRDRASIVESLLRRGIKTLERPAREEIPCRLCASPFTPRYYLQDVCVECVGRFSQLTAAQARETRAAEERAELARLGLSGEMTNWTFATFVRAAQPLAYDTALAVANFYPERKGLALLGKPGAGKSHLAVAILQELRDSRVRGLYAHVPAIARRLRYAEDWGAEARRIFPPMDDTPILVLDDCGRGKVTEAWSEAIDALMDHRWANGLPTVLTGNLTQAELTGWLGAAASSRFLASTAGDVIALGDRDWRLKPLATVPKPAPIARERRDPTKPCPTCAGAGWVVDAKIPVGRADRLLKCLACSGEGY